jgi:redox-sensitive bicupin YhaK (pirin superfamily)
MRAGDVQRISAGTGIRHSEVNESPSEPIHLLQIWILPDARGVTPRYDEASFGSIPEGILTCIASKSGRDHSIPIHQDAEVLVGKLAAGQTIQHTTRADRGVWIQLISGVLEANGTVISAGDGAGITNEATVKLTAGEPAHFLLFDLG